MPPQPVEEHHRRVLRGPPIEIMQLQTISHHSLILRLYLESHAMSPYAGSRVILTCTLLSTPGALAIAGLRCATDRHTLRYTDRHPPPSMQFTPFPLAGEGGTLNCAPSADAVAGNGAPLMRQPSADAVAP